jgi:thermostable 8-oxoguanine DNA glycosylase
MYTNLINERKRQMTTYIKTYSDIAKKATFGQVEQATKWYLDAETIAREVATNLNTTLEIGATVVSAFSPRERWARNVSNAVKFSLGHELKGVLGNNIRMAEKALTMGFDALKGMKTNAFAKAIAGNENAVVIDVWMLRALGIEKKTPTQSQYKEMADAVTAVATKHGMTPRAMQALIWIVVRGSGE